MHGRGILALEDAVTPVDCTGHFRLDETNVLIAARSAVKFRFSPAAATASNAQSIVSLAGFPLPFHNHAGWGTSSPEKTNAHKISNRVDIDSHCFGYVFRIPMKDTHLYLPKLGIGPEKVSDS